MSSVFGWLGIREQKGIIADARRHMEKVLETVSLLGPVVEALCDGRIDEANQLHEKLAATEHEADIIRRDIMTRLYHGLLHPLERQDLSRLLGSMDDVADQAEGASRIAILFDQSPGLYKEELVYFTNLLQQATSQLAQSLEMLSSDRIDQALEACTQVEILEEEGDRLKHDIMKKLFSADLPANLLLLLYILVESMENTIDRAEDSADLVRVLAVSQKR
ncbi:MAG: TIGR00153 family protein [Firmicutes bacterium]|jgi:predicted phosphate transport protein (TIGR00153 family)|nr:TIGR00153 family protein [Bacillota bacterium]